MRTLNLYLFPGRYLIQPLGYTVFTVNILQTEYIFHIIFYALLNLYIVVILETPL